MKYVDYKLTLELTDIKNLKRIKGFRVGENEGRRIILTFSENGKAFSLDGVTGVFRVKTPNGNEWYNNVVVIGNAIYIVPSTFEKEGIARCEIQLSDDSGILYSPSFEIEVGERVCGDDVVEGSNEFTALQELMLEVGDLQEVKKSSIASRDDAEGFASAAEESARASSESASLSNFYASESSARALESVEARDDAKIYSSNASRYSISAGDSMVAAGNYAQDAQNYSEQAKAQVDLLHDEWNFTLYEDSPDWISGGGAFYGFHILKKIKLSSGKKYYVKINVEAEADDIVGFFLGYNGTVSQPMTYVDGYYECEFNGFDFEGETRIGWESEWGSITATKITISQMDSMAEVLGNIDKALDRIIAIQDSLIGGEG